MMIVIFSVDELETSDRVRFWHFFIKSRNRLKFLAGKNRLVEPESCFGKYFYWNNTCQNRDDEEPPPLKFSSLDRRWEISAPGRALWKIFWNDSGSGFLLLGKSGNSSWILKNISLGKILLNFTLKIGDSRPNRFIRRPQNSEYFEKLVNFRVAPKNGNIRQHFTDDRPERPAINGTRVDLLGE